MTITTADALPPGWTVSTRLLPQWPIDDEHVLELSPVERTDDDRIRWGYRLARHNKTIFAARDIYSGAGDAVTTNAYVAAARTVLSFLTLDSAIDHECTPTQQSWRERYAEQLSVYAIDGWCGYCGNDHHSPACPDR